MNVRACDGTIMGTDQCVSSSARARQHSLCNFTPLCSRFPHWLVASATIPKALVRADMLDISRRRIATVARHLLPTDASSSQSYENVLLDSSSPLQPQNTAAEESSYAKVHGAVSRKAAKWTQIPTVQRHDLSEIIYDKVREEGIAKVSG